MLCFKDCRNPAIYKALFLLTKQQIIYRQFCVLWCEHETDDSIMQFRLNIVINLSKCRD